MHINPFFWWGSFAVSAPIIIHLINRLRFKKIRWAAMEFLLKAQQRNRRRLIIEQLILLALRCLILMVLVTMLTRPQWLMGENQDTARAGRTNYHVILVDDSLSMRDRSQPGEERSTAFRAALNQVEKLADDFKDDVTTHYITVITASNPDVPVFGTPLAILEEGGGEPGKQMSGDSIGELKNALAKLVCSYTRPNMKAALEKSRRYLEKVKKDGNKHFHLISDFRLPDWTETNGDAMAEELLLALAKEASVEVRMHDVASPTRFGDKDGKGAVPKDRSPPSHRNLGITQLVAKTRKLSEGEEADRSDRFFTPTLPVHLYATLRNFTDTEIENVRLFVTVDGMQVSEASVNLAKIPVDPKGMRVPIEFRFTPQMTTGYKRVSVHIDEAVRGEEGDSGADHLVEDNSWYVYLELRSEIPVLIIDPDHATREFQPDSFILDAALTGNPKNGYKCFFAKPTELKGLRLNQFPVIYVLNVAGYMPQKLGGGDDRYFNEESLKALEQYVYNGGSVVFYLGDHVDWENYNRYLFRDAAARTSLGSDFKDVNWFSRRPGIFPARLDGDAKTDFPDELDTHPKVRLLRDRHPAWGLETETADWFVNRMFVARYFPVDATKPENLAAKARVVMQLMNREPLFKFATLVKEEITDKLVERVGQPGADPTETDRLRYWLDQISSYMANPHDKKARKGPLLRYLQDLIDDPKLGNYWKQNVAFVEKLEKVRDELRSGWPLVIEAEYADEPTAAPVEPKEAPQPETPVPQATPVNPAASTARSDADRPRGHVMAVVTQHAPKAIGGDAKNLDWNNWASMTFPAYVVHMLQLQAYMASLSRTGDEIEIQRLLGGNHVVRLPVDKYSETVRLYYVPVALDGTLAPQDPDAPKVIFKRESSSEAVEEPLLAEEQRGRTEGDYHHFVLSPRFGPGFYLLRVNIPRNPDKDRTGKPVEPAGDVDTDSDTSRKPATLPLVFNVDSRIEGDLRRISEQAIYNKFTEVALDPTKGGMKALEAQTFIDSRNWFSKGGPSIQLNQPKSWADHYFMLAVFLVLLAIESFLAMLFSHHLKDGQAALPPQALRGMRVVATRPGMAAEAEAVMR